MYNVPKTWIDGPWPFTDANLYIRDNFVSVRRYQTGMQTFNDTASLGTVDTTFGTHLNLLSSTPDESFEMSIVTFCFANTMVTGPNLFFNVQDHTSTPILVTGAAALGFSMTTTITGTAGETVGVMSKAQYPAGVNPGFSYVAHVNAGSMAVKVMSQVSFRPLV